MTDEEMAEKYAKELCKTCTLDTCRYSTIQTCAIKEYLKQAHLAGLKAGRPKWHDLRKDPNDLPKVNQKVLLQIKDEGRPIIDFYTRYGVWNFANEYEAIAWCEIPKFDEE